MRVYKENFFPTHQALIFFKICLYNNLTLLLNRDNGLQQNSSDKLQFDENYSFSMQKYLTFYEFACSVIIKGHFVKFEDKAKPLEILLIETNFIISQQVSGLFCLKKSVGNKLF